MSDLPGFITNSTLPQWLTAVFSGGILAAMLRFVLGWRNQSLTAEEAIRDHYAKEVSRLSENLTRIETYWKDLLEMEKKEHDECRVERQELRKRVTKLEDELAGIKRQIAAYSSDKLMLMEDRGKPSTIAPEATASAQRVKKITDD